MQRNVQKQIYVKIVRVLDKKLIEAMVKGIVFIIILDLKEIIINITRNIHIYKFSFIIIIILEELFHL